MEAVYACKLYRASNRKDKIQAAIADPLNLELVTQLKSYLDEEYQEVIDQQQAKEKSESVDTLVDKTDRDEGSAREDAGSRSFGGGGFSGPSGSRPSLSEKFDMLTSGDEGNDDFGDAPEVDVGDLDEPEEANEELNLDDVEQSTAIEGIQEMDRVVATVSDISTDVKELLNSDEATSGINRVMNKQNELWIHYNDNVNLNNVMGPAIEKLNVEGYDRLEFNRLARSENAIVFQVTGHEGEARS